MDSARCWQETDGRIFRLDIPPSAVARIPGIAYTFPDLDAKPRILINRTDGEQAGQSVACIEADFTNGNTVDLVSIKWATALVYERGGSADWFKFSYK